MSANPFRKTVQLVLFKKMEEIISQGLLPLLNKLQPAYDRINAVFHGRKYSGAGATDERLLSFSNYDLPYKVFEKI